MSWGCTVRNAKRRRTFWKENLQDCEIFVFTLSKPCTINFPKMAMPFFVLFIGIVSTALLLFSAIFVYYIGVYW